MAKCAKRESDNRASSTTINGPIAKGFGEKCQHTESISWHPKSFCDKDIAVSQNKRIGHNGCINMLEHYIMSVYADGLDRDSWDGLEKGTAALECKKVTNKVVLRQSCTPPRAGRIIWTCVS